MSETITPAEAMEEMKRRHIGVSYYRDKGDWQATALEPVVTVGTGPTPEEAVADCLTWIATWEAAEQVKVVSNV